MIEFKIQNKTIKVSSLKIEGTYGRILAGSPADPFVIKNLLEDYKETLKRKFSDRPILFIELILIEEKLPPNAVYVSLKSEAIDTTQYSGAELYILFFAKIDFHDPLEKILADNLQEVDYWSNCRDFIY